MQKINNKPHLVFQNANYTEIRQQAASKQTESHPLTLKISQFSNNEADCSRNRRLHEHQSTAHSTLRVAQKRAIQKRPTTPICPATHWAVSRCRKNFTLRTEWSWRRVMCDRALPSPRRRAHIVTHANAEREANYYSHNKQTKLRNFSCRALTFIFLFCFIGL